MHSFPKSVEDVGTLIEESGAAFARFRHERKRLVGDQSEEPFYLLLVPSQPPQECLRQSLGPRCKYISKIVR
jgi:hypothetical protein